MEFHNESRSHTYLEDYSRVSSEIVAIWASYSDKISGLDDERKEICYDDLKRLQNACIP